jgi:thioredoxin 1
VVINRVKNQILHIKLKEDITMAVITITKDNYENEVVKSDKPVLLDFWATWCGPCRMVSPTVEQIADEHPEYKVGKVNVDEEAELSMMFKVSGIPTLVAMKGGEVAGKQVGVHSKQDILTMMKGAE